MAKGVKTCSNCGKEVRGPRTRVCPHCQHILISSMRYGQQTEDIKVLKKVIEKYNDGEDVDKICLEIRQIPQLPLTKKAEIDWRTLEKGYIIKVSQFGGNTWKNNDGQEVPMGYSGNFKVLYRDKNGIHANGMGKESGHSYIWMAEEMTTEAGVTRKPHVILKVKKFVNDKD